jgi:predicted ester cyclase
LDSTRGTDPKHYEVDWSETAPTAIAGAGAKTRVSGKIEEAGVPTLEDNKELIRRYTRAVFDEGDVAAVDEYLASDFYNHVSGKTGTEDFKELANDVGQGPGNANIIDLLVAEGEFVVAYMTITRTVHKQRHVFGFTIPGEGRSYTVKHIHIYRVVDSRIREHWAVRDDLSMLRQLDVLP